LISRESSVTPEAAVKKKVRAILDYFGVYYFSPATGGYGRSGVPDVIACYRGKFIAVEVKAGDNKPTALQERELSQIKKRGGVALVVNEKNLDELHDLLGSLTAECI
jgi:Holliday junction resolvase